MNNIVIFFLILSLFQACSHKKMSEQGNTASTDSASERSNKKPQEASGPKAIFHIIEPLGVELILVHLGNRKSEVVIMDKTLSQLDLPTGYWQVSGFVLEGKTYKLLNIKKSFVFQIKKNQNTYVGSYIFQCPKVSAQHNSDLKKMKFFNRYPFQTQKGLCEMVVGSDYEKVNKVWLDLGKDANKSLGLGF